MYSVDKFCGFVFGVDLPPPPEPPPCQGQGRIQGARSISSMVPPTERKASSLERPSMSGQDDMKNSIDRQTRTSLDHHRQAQERLGSMERADDGRRGHKTGTVGASLNFIVIPQITIRETTSLWGNTIKNASFHLRKPHVVN